MKKLPINTAIKITFKNKEVKEYKSIEEASKDSGLTIASLKLRCNKSKVNKDGIACEWLDSYTKHYYMAKKNKHKGSGFEYEIIKTLTALGYKGLKTSRGESKTLDNNKIDIADLNNSLSCYIQAKATSNTPNIEEITKACPLKDKPLVVYWNKQNSEEKNHRYVLVPMEYFNKLLANYDL